MVTIIERAPAKINLGLDIQGKRLDGYHDLDMVMVSVDLCDYVTVEALEQDEILFSSNCPKMPTNQKNDVYKVARLIKDQFQVSRGVSIFLDKHIPVCAGMGGGSSDAAATIRALNQLWQLDLTQEQMIAIGMQIGSDVPYCLSAGCAQVTGKGEVVKPIKGRLSSWVVLVKPEFGISTKTVFPDVDCETISRVSIPNLVAAIELDDYQALIASMGNSLEDISKPMIQKLRIKWCSQELMWL